MNLYRIFIILLEFVPLGASAQFKTANELLRAFEMENKSFNKLADSLGFKQCPPDYYITPECICEENGTIRLFTNCRLIGKWRDPKKPTLGESFLIIMNPPREDFKRLLKELKKRDDFIRSKSSDNPNEVLFSSDSFTIILNENLPEVEVYYTSVFKPEKRPDRLKVEKRH